MAYTPINAIAAPGVDLNAHAQEVENQKNYLANNDVASINKDALYARYADIINQTLGGTGQNSAVGYYTSDAAEAQRAANQYGATVTPTTYEGQSGWYYVDGADRTVQEGASGADEDYMSDADYAIVRQLKANWTEYDALYKTHLTQGDTETANYYLGLRDEAHAQAERIRMGYGYMGGSDGSQYLTLGELGVSRKGSAGSENGYGGVDTGTGAGGKSEFPGMEVPDLTSLLERWKAAALEQSNGQIDYAVQRAITELERALEDARPQFKEQAEAVAKDEMQALDNSALYAEMRGDKGGIGQSQYNEIQAAAAQNRLAVRQAQTQLSTDTARQIADLRAQGEFQKADQALEISQQYLSQLIGLEQWAAEFGLSAEQFQESIRQWEAEYNLEMQQFRVNTDLAYKQYDTDTDLAYAQLTGQLADGTLTLSGKNQLSAMGEALLSVGIMPDADMLAAMGLSESQALAYITAIQPEEVSRTGSGSKTTGSGDAGGDDTTGDILDALFLEAYVSGNPAAHLTNTDAYKNYGLTSKTGLVEEYEKWLNDQNTKGNNLLVTDIAGLAEQWRDMMEMYRWSPVSLYEAMVQGGYNDIVIDAVLAKLGL